MLPAKPPEAATEDKGRNCPWPATVIQARCQGRSAIAYGNSKESPVGLFVSPGAAAQFLADSP